jgi:hypothetical protein
VDNTVIGATHTELHVLYTKFFQRIRSPKFTANIQHALSYTMPDVHQPVLRDCHWNHVLFSDSDDCVTGFIDIDAAGWDDPAVDISRLLGSWQLENPQSEEWLVDLWPDAFKQYRTSVNAGADFPSRVQVLHDTAILCGIDRLVHLAFHRKPILREYGTGFPTNNSPAQRSSGCDSAA